MLAKITSPLIDRRDTVNDVNKKEEKNYENKRIVILD